MKAIFGGGRAGFQVFCGKAAFKVIGKKNNNKVIGKDLRPQALDTENLTTILSLLFTW